VDRGVQAAPPGPPPGDYPLPQALTAGWPFIYNADEPAVSLYPKFARRLAEAGDLYRRPGHADGLLLASPCPDIPPEEIITGKQLAAVVTDRLPLAVIKGGKPKGSRIPPADLDNMLRSELFLRQFRPVDQVVYRPMYLGDFRLTRPGYNDGGRGQRVIYVGEEPEVVYGTDTIRRFLDVMPFASNADRSNAVAAALTVMLRNYWPGGKPLVLVTSTTSHGGTDTIVAFAAGGTPKVSISLAYLERLLTDPNPVLYSPGTGSPVRLPNHWVVAMTTNFGAVSEDLMNRALPIHLTPKGDVAGRRSPIGDPKLEFLPANWGRIEAELRGLIEGWKREGAPRDDSARHPFKQWAAVIGGILRVGGFADFLANYGERRTSDDPVKLALGRLGAARPEQWLPAAEWAPLVAYLGLTDPLIPKAERESAESRRRGLGVVLSHHQDETFEVETDDEVLKLRLEKKRARFNPGEEPTPRYRFLTLERRPLPEDEGI
jgi:hypothetical protein